MGLVSGHGLFIGPGFIRPLIPSIFLLIGREHGKALDRESRVSAAAAKISGLE